MTWRQLSSKIYGTPPPPTASKLDRLRYVRRLSYLANLPGMIAVLAVLVFLVPSTLSSVVAIVCGGVFFGGLLTISVRIRREQDRETRLGPPSAD